MLGLARPYFSGRPSLLLDAGGAREPASGPLADWLLGKQRTCSLVLLASASPRGDPAKPAFPRFGDRPLITATAGLELPEGSSLTAIPIFLKFKTDARGTHHLAEIGTGFPKLPSEKIA